jgi:pimeloyl-ACP methyl ester carboxylesterase
VFIFEAIFLIGFWGFVASAGLLLWYASSNRVVVDPVAHALNIQPVQFVATDGTPLYGWKVRGDPQAPWVIGCHGLGSAKSELVGIAQALNAQGLNSFLFDFRGHGESCGRLTSFGFHEQRDLEGALAFLAQQPEVPDYPIGVLGISMGSAVALQVAARDERIGAIVADGVFPDLDFAFKQHCKGIAPWLPYSLIRPFVASAYRVLFGTWPWKVSPQQVAPLLESCPVLLLSGSEDQQVPPASLQRIAALLPHSTLQLFPGTGHLEGFTHQKDDYCRTVAEFFNQHLHRRSWREEGW